MKGWLVTNAWLKSRDFDIQYKWMLESAEDLEQVSSDQILAGRVDQFPDFAIGYDKDVVALEYLERQGVRVVNSSESVRICDDKALIHTKLLGTGISLPRTLISPLVYRPLNKEEWRESNFYQSIIDKFTFPLVAKVATGSWGRGVELVSGEEEVLQFLESYGTSRVIIQEFIRSSVGRDVRLFFLGDDCIASMERKSSTDFRANVAGSGKGLPFLPNEDTVESGRTVMRTLGLKFAGLDYLFGPDGDLVFCEANSNPQFVELSKVTGVDVARRLVGTVFNEQ